MHQNQSGLYTTNSLSRHASLLLSQTPTIISSPLQNNTNNPQNSPAPPSIALARRQPSTQLLVANNLDHDTHINTDSPSNVNPQEDFINFKQPQNEIFKKLDGKIQKIVAAHSNLNKLYALNDFSSLGVGPKRPFELPPQLPPPPPWVPKVSTEFVNQFDGMPSSALNPLRVSPPNKVRLLSMTPNPGVGNSKNLYRCLVAPSAHNSLLTTATSPITASKSPSVSLDSAISKLHQRRQQQLLQQQQKSRSHPQQQETNRRTILGSKTPKSPSSRLVVGARPPLPKQQLFSDQKTATLSIRPAPHGPMADSSASSSSTSNDQLTPTMTPAQFTLLAQKIKETLETECAFKNQGANLCPEDKRKFQEDLINLLKREISAVTKSANLQFSPPPNARPKIIEQKSLLLKSSPQTLFNTIRRETSILLNKRQHSQTARSSLSLLSDQQTFNRQNAHVSHSTHISQSIKRPQTMKVIIPPIELHNGLKFDNYLEKESPQPTEEIITVEQFAKCLNLVRSNDASLQRHQEHLLQAETKWKMHASNRPLRLRRLRGERIHMPASASYKATRKVGLQ